MLVAKLSAIRKLLKNFLQERESKYLAKQETRSQQKTVKTIVVDGTNLIAGRLCSHVAKLLLDDNRVSIVNCENIMIRGTKRNIMEEYKKFLEISSIINPKFGPFHPRRPDTIISKMVRGMILRKITRSVSNYTTMTELVQNVGWNR